MGLPQRNGAIYTCAHRGNHTGTGIELASLGITFTHRKPYHDQTQGQDRAPPPHREEMALTATSIYNEERLHSAHGCPPMQAWRALDKSTVEIDGQPLLSRTKSAAIASTRPGALHLASSIEIAPRRDGTRASKKRVLILVAHRDVRVIDESGATIRHLELDPSVDFQRQDMDIV